HRANSPPRFIFFSGHKGGSRAQTTACPQNVRTSRPPRRQVIDSFVDSANPRHDIRQCFGLFNVRVLPNVLAYALAGFAALVGLVGVGSGFYGLYTLDSLERLMTMGHAFEGNVSATEWRAGYETSMAMFISFGIAALVAAYGLFRGQRWAQYLWLLLVAIHIIAPAQELPWNIQAWIWLGD